MKPKAVVLFVALFLWSGCSSSIEVMVAGQSDMNNGGNAAVVHVYELNSENNFVNTPVSAFWQDAEGALGGELIAAHQQRVYPNETEVLEFELSDNTKVIGVAANLRDPEREQWRAHYSVEDLGDEISVVVYNNRISVEAEGAGVLKRTGVTGP